MLYYIVMNYIGILYTALIFAGCFIFVHFIALAAAGFKSIRQKPQPKPEEPKKPEPQKIYYIVEKKRAKKSSYSEPKEIDFK